MEKGLQGRFCVFFLLVCYLGESNMNAEATQNVLRGSLASSFCRYFARSLREAAFWTRRPQNTPDLNTPRGSKFVLSPARRASFLKITFFPLDSFPARLESPRSVHFGPLFWPEGTTWTLKPLKLQRQRCKKGACKKPQKTIKHHEGTKI